MFLEVNGRLIDACLVKVVPGAGGKTDQCVADRLAGGNAEAVAPEPVAVDALGGDRTRRGTMVVLRELSSPSVLPLRPGQGIDRASYKSAELLCVPSAASCTISSKLSSSSSYSGSMVAKGLRDICECRTREGYWFNGIASFLRLDVVRCERYRRSGCGRPRRSATSCFHSVSSPLTPFPRRQHARTLTRISTIVAVKASPVSKSRTKFSYVMFATPESLSIAARRSAPVLHPVPSVRYHTRT